VILNGKLSGTFAWKPVLECIISSSIAVMFLHILARSMEYVVECQVSHTSYSVINLTSHYNMLKFSPFEILKKHCSCCTHWQVSWASNKEMKPCSWHPVSPLLFLWGQDRNSMFRCSVQVTEQVILPAEALTPEIKRHVHGLKPVILLCICHSVKRIQGEIYLSCFVFNV